MHKSMMTLEYPKQILFDECIAMNCNFLMKASQLSCQPCHLLKRPSSKRAFLQLPTLQLENCARFNTLAAVCTVGLFENPVSDKEGICKSNLHDYLHTAQTRVELAWIVTNIWRVDFVILFINATKYHHAQTCTINANAGGYVGVYKFLNVFSKVRWYIFERLCIDEYFWNQRFPAMSSIGARQGNDSFK